MTRAQWFFVLAVAAAAAVFFARRPKPEVVTITETFTLNEDAGKVERLPPGSQVHGASSAGALQTTHQPKPKKDPPVPQPK